MSSMYEETVYIKVGVKHSIYGNQHITLRGQQFSSLLVPRAALEDLVLIVMGVGIETVATFGPEETKPLEQDEDFVEIFKPIRNMIPKPEWVEFQYKYLEMRLWSRLRNSPQQSRHIRPWLLMGCKSLVTMAAKTKCNAKFPMGKSQRQNGGENAAHRSV